MQQLGTRNIALLIIAIALISTVLIFKTDGNPQHIFTGGDQTNLIVDAVRKNKDTDSDNDSVPDWEEILRGTDPQNPNTFGVEGGDEAYIEAKKEKEGTDGVSVLTNTDNLTEQIALGTFGEYMQQRSGDLPVGYGSPEELAAAIAGQSFQISNPTVYTKTNLKVVDTNKNSMLLYADALRTIDEKYPDSQFAGIGSAINNAISGDPDDPESGKKLLANLSPYISLYEKVVTDLLAITVPDQFTNEHLNLVNSTEGARYSLQQLTKLDTDPARSLLGAQLFPEYANTIEETYRVIVQKLQAENIPL